jgi:hypothetical protein
MLDSKTRNDADQAVAAAAPASDANAKRASLGVRLVPVNNSDQPIMTNYVQVNAAPGTAFIDFGFLEPGVLSALPRVAQQGGKLPQTINGKLVVRVAVGYEGIATLHQQLGRLLSGLGAAAAAAKARKANGPSQ